MSSGAIFDNDSSDEDDETPAVSSQEKAKEEEAKKDNKPAFADDSDSDDDGDGKGMDVNGGKASERKEGESKAGDKEAKAKSRPSLFGEDSEDDSDEEFDDKGAIEGSSAPAAGTTQDSSTPGESAATPSKTAHKPPESATVLYASRPDDGITMHMTKLPNLVAIQPSAFEESKYDGLEEEEQYKGYVHNMIRWRYKKNENGDFERDSSGGLVRESNTKLVKWEDGSYTLHIGDESFAVQTVDHQEPGSTARKSFLYLSQKATYGSTDDGEEGNGGTMLECVGGVTSRLIPKPSSLQSEAHKSLTVAVRQKTMKRAKIAEWVTQEDPEKLRADRIRTHQDEDKIRARKTGGYRAGGGGGGGTRRRKPGMNRRYMEGDDDDDVYETTDISGIKKRTTGEDDDMSDYGDESDDSDGYNDTTFRGSRDRKRQKRALEEEEDAEEELVFDDDDDDEDDVALAKAPTKKRAHQAVVDDDDSE